MKTATVRARIEPELKHDVESVLTTLGLSFSEAIVLFLRQVKLKNGMPFDIRIPNEITKQTFRNTDEGKDLNHYDTAQDMFDKLGM